MPIPKSEKLAQEEANSNAVADRVPDMEANKSLGDTISIKPLEMLNENVAVLCFAHEIGGGLVIPDGDALKDEGIVIGIGKGVPDGAGGRTKSQLEIGDVVSFMGKNVLFKYKPNSGVYQDQHVFVINERSLISKLPPVKFEIIDA